MKICRLGQRTPTTPKTYLEFLKLYASLLKQKNIDSNNAVERLENGLMKLKETAAIVQTLEAELKIKLVAAEEKKVKAEGIAEVVAKEKAVVEKETAMATEEAAKCAVIQEEVTKIATDAQNDLDAAEPLVAKAMEALNTLNKKELGECKTMSKPPSGVDDVFSAVMVLVAGVKKDDGSGNDLTDVQVSKSGKVRDRSWGAAKKALLGNVSGFLDALLNYKKYVDEFVVPTINWKEVRQYLSKDTFDVDIISGKNKAAAGLCSWVINIVTYYDTIVGVEPKRQALAAAKQKLATASEQLKVVNERVAVLNEKLSKLRAEYDAASKEKQEAIDTVEKGKLKLDLAQRLTTALASENVRWAENVVQLKANEKLLTGDVLVASAFLTYIGPFTKPYRDNLMHQWIKYLKTSVKGGEGFPISPDANPLTIVSTEAEQAGWRSNSLPDDPVSTENGAIVSNSARWPLMIDPQLQGIQWIKDQEGSKLSVGRLGQKDLRQRLISSLQDGSPFLIENMGETIEATLMPVVARQTFTRGKKKLIKLGDDEIELHPNFKLYLHTKLSNPHYPPEIQAETTLVNFTVTETGLEDQLLALVVRKERADLAEERAQLVQQNNEFQVKLVELENTILKKLAEAEGDITEDVALIESLEETKRVSTDIASKMEIAKKTTADIQKTSEKYRPVAARGSLLFFVMNSIFRLHSFYMFSLNAFVVTFLHGIDLVSEPKEAAPKAKKTGAGFGGLMSGLGKKKGKMSLMDRFRKAARKSVMVKRMAWDVDMLHAAGRPSKGKIERLPDLSDEELEKRCVVLEDSISKVVFNYLRRGLFDKDKLTVATQLCLKILLKSGELTAEAVDILVMGPLSNKPGNNGVLAEWIPQACWERVKGLEVLEQFKSLGDNMISDCDDWRVWFDCEKPEEAEMPGDYINLDTFSKILLLRAMRPDRVTAELTAFIGDKLGKTFINQPAFDMEKTYDETSPATPVFFVLFPGVDPTKLVESLGDKKGFTAANGKFSNISMGQGQEENAEATMKRFSNQGGWVFLQNVHLMPGWLSVLERTLEKCSAQAHDDFRCFISAEPPPIPSWKTIPESLLQSCIKVSNEAPSDVKSNLRRAWATFNQERISSCPKEVEFKACLFTICFFHSLILGRRKFGQQGWSRKYSFNVGDLSVCADVCQSYITAATDIPWDDMRYIFGEIMYGGHITDPWDRKTNNTYLNVLLQPGIFQGEELVPCRKGLVDIEGKPLSILFPSPNPTECDFEAFNKTIEEKLPKEAPVLFGLHPNAEIGYLTNTTAALFTSIITLRGGGGGGEDSAGSSVDVTLMTLLDKLPANFIMVEINEMAKPLLADRDAGPYVIVALQECTRMNVLLSAIRISLEELQKGLDGSLNMSDAMEDLAEALGLNQVPGRNPFHRTSWEKLAWASEKILQSWFSDLLLRVEQLVDWVEDLSLPKSMWLPGLFNPMAYNTAVMQVTARQTGFALDNMTIETHITAYRDVAAIQKGPESGVFIHGLYIEGAKWFHGEDAPDPEDVGGVPTQGYLIDSQLKELLPPMPVVYLRAVVVHPEWEPSSVGYLRHNPKIYECPVYVTRFRGPTYVFLATLNCVDDTSRWTLGGVALVMQSDD
jgi:dynein heavy chain, axonemal